MSASCCATSVPHHHGSFEVFPKAVAAWQERLTAGLSRSIQASDETMGHMEEEILHKTRDLQRAVLEEAAQKKAEKSPPTCPVCGNKLSRITHGHERSYQTVLESLQFGGRAAGAAAVNAGVFQPITFWDWPRPVVALLGCRRWQRWQPVSCR